LRPEEVLSGWHAETERGLQGMTSAMDVEAQAVLSFREQFVQATDEDKAQMRRLVLQESGTLIAVGVLARASDSPEERRERLRQIEHELPAE
jgi:hypothetical protein